MPDKPKLKERFTFTTKLQAGVILNSPYSIFCLGKFEDAPVIVSVERPRSRRTLSQNNWWHGFIIPPVAEKTGMSHEETHRFLEGEFCPRYVKRILGKDRVFIHRCSQLTKGEFAEIVERVRAFLADYGIEIQDPDPLKSTTRLDANI